MSRILGWFLLTVGVASLAWSLESSARAQEGDRRGRRGGFGDRFRMGFPPMMPPQGGAPQPSQEGDKTNEKPAEGEKKPESTENKGPKLPEPVKRPVLPDRPANPMELEVEPDDDGLVSFSFKGQPWPSVLEWLADISDMSLQWEEAPAGYLDLTTRGRYSVTEVRDLINSVLLSKGFTLLSNGDVLIVANLKHLDPSLVPRVTLQDLDKRGNYELVKVFFDLDWLLAENAAEEIKPMLSPYGKVTPLKTTNRLDVLETVSNLRRIHQLLLEEQSDSGQQHLVREFRLRHTRAAEVLETLQTLLGIEPKKTGSEPLDPRALMAQQMMMAQQQGQQGGPPGATRKEKESQVYLVVNSRENSILANAPPDKMAIIEQAISVVDVAQNREQSLLGNLPRMQVYRLSGVTPETLVKVLTELGGLDPTTRLEVDAKNRAIIAYAPLADHVLIRSLVDKLDGSGRRFEVIQLRMLSAEYVAGSIQTLMTGPEKTDNSRGRSRFSYYYDGDSSSPQDGADSFQVEADIEHNRLLLRANDVELAEIKTLLIKLGEIPPEGRTGYTTRVVPTAPGDDAEKLLRRLQQAWPSVAPNPLEVEGLENLGGDKGQEENESEARPDARRRPRPPAPKPEPEASRPRGNRLGRESEARRGRESTDDAVAQGPRYRFAQDVRVKKVEDESAPETETATEAGDDAPSTAAKDQNADETSPAAQPETKATAAEPEPAAEAPAAPKREKKAMADDEPAEAEFQAPASPPPLGGRELPRAAHAPIKITVGPYGITISSSDTEALDRLEDLISDITPPRNAYKVFKLKNTYAKDVALLLEDVFKDDESASKKSDPFETLWFGRSSQPEKTRSTLGKRRPLKFIPDTVTNTILVQGADPNQLAEIESLLKIYDQQETPDSNSVRRTQLVALRYAKAAEVSEIVKDVYRDLLSPNDKALQKGMQPQPQQQQQRDGGFYSAMFSYLSDDPAKSQNIPRFKGMLSVGIDERSNSLAVSAPQLLLEDVLEMVGELDQAAKPTRQVVRVLKLNQPGAVEQIQRAFGAKAAAPTPAAQPADNQDQPQGPAPGRMRGMGQGRSGNQGEQN